MSQAVPALLPATAPSHEQARPRVQRDLVGWTLLLLGIAVHLLFLASLRWGWLNPLFDDTMHRFGPGADFFSIYAAGVKARLGESVYTIGGHVEQVPYAYAFRYVPVVAYTLGAGLSLLPAVAAYGLWLILCELALLRNIRLTLQLASRQAEVDGGERPSGPSPYALAALWLLFSPYYLELYVGQFTFLTASLVFWAYLRWHAAPAREEKRAQRWERRLGDLCWSGAVLLKLMPLLYLPLALLRGRWKGALVTAAILGATSWLYFAHFPRDWAVFAATNGDPRPTWHAGNEGLMALLFTLSGERLGPYLQARNGALALVGVFLGSLLIRAWWQAGGWPFRRRLKPEVGRATPDTLILYTACTTAYLLLYKDVWEHHYVLLLPPLVLLALRRESPWLWLPPFVICAVPGLFGLFDLPGLGYNEDPQRYWRPAVSILQHGWKPLAPLWLTVAILLRAFRGASLPAGTIPETSARLSARRGIALRQVVIGVAALLAATALFGAARWANAEIAAQRRLSRVLVWSPEVFQRQERPETCGPAALAAVCRHFGVPATEEELAGLADTGPGGTTMLGLEEAAQAKGLSAVATQVQPGQLRTLPRPCLLYLRQGRFPGHFVVLTGIEGKRCYLADPSAGQRVWREALLMRYWTGEALLVGPGESPSSF